MPGTYFQPPQSHPKVTVVMGFTCLPPSPDVAVPMCFCGDPCKVERSDEPETIGRCTRCVATGRSIRHIPPSSSARWSLHRFVILSSGSTLRSLRMTRTTLTPLRSGMKKERRGGKGRRSRRRPRGSTTRRSVGGPRQGTRVKGRRS